jgi:penicillin-binding protein 1A
MRSNYWGEGRHNALLVVGDFFQQTLGARLIDSGAEFPFERPHDSFWEPLLDTAKEWLDGIFRNWGLGERARPDPLPPPPPRRDREREAARGGLEDSQEQRGLERQLEKQRLLELLKRKREQREREQGERDGYR